MAARVTRLAHPAALTAPDQETQEQALGALRLELEAEGDASLGALLGHEIARLHERREDLAAAARDELAATKKAAGFIEPLESLVDIAIRSRSKANLAKLLERLQKLSHNAEERVRASLGLALTLGASAEWTQARDVTLAALDLAPTEPVLWLTLEAVAAHLGDHQLLLKATTGRAAHAQSTEMRCLLLERVARLQMEAGDKDSALASLRQSVDELPSWRALHTWEEIAFLAGDFAEAGRAAVQTATILRAGLEEPEEAELYQIPPDELTESRAIAAHLRAVSFALRNDDIQEARGLVEQLSEASPTSPLVLALLMELCRKQGDVEGVLSSLQRLLSARDWSNEEAAALLTIRARTATTDGLFEEADQSIEQILQRVPSTLLPKVHAWISAEREESLETLTALVLSWAKGKTAEDTISSSLALSAALFQLIGGAPTAARETLARYIDSRAEDVESPHSGQPRLARLLLELTRNLDGSETNPGSRLSPPSQLVTPGDDQKTLQYNELREELTTKGPRRVSSQLAALDPWTALLLSILTPPSAAGDSVPPPYVDPSPSQGEEVPPTAQWNGDEVADVAEAKPQLSLPAPPATLREAVAQYCVQGEPPPALERALWALATAECGDGADLGRRFRETPHDAFFTAAYLAHLATAAPEDVPKARAEAAEYLSDANLAAAWLLKSSFDFLRRASSETTAPLNAPSANAEISGNVGPASAISSRTPPSGQANSPGARSADIQAAAAALQQLRQLVPGTFDPLSWWLEVHLTGGDPARLLEKTEHTEARPVTRAALLHRLRPDELLGLRVENPSAPLLLLRALHASTADRTRLSEILEEADFLTSEQKAQLGLAANWSTNDPAALLLAATEYVRAAPSPATLLVQWVSAVKAGDRKAQSEATSALAELLGSDALLPAIAGGTLRGEAQQKNVAGLLRLRGETPQSPAPEDDDDPQKAAARRESNLAAWCLIEQQVDEVSREHAEGTVTFARFLDLDLKSADAQSAALVSAFEFISLGDTDRALEILEALYRHLPEDLTVCRGLQLVAHETARPDLEAPALRELARAEESNARAADLWERAGILFEDSLHRPKEAEECFASALGRRPGSRLAFERLYRFARARKDRLRQVELLDARIETADSEDLLIELYWEKARYCRMLGRRAVALASLQDLLSLAPQHLPSLALSAELHLVEGQMSEAADILREIAQHPDTADSSRATTGLYACDLFEHLNRSKDAVDLLQFLDAEGLTGPGGLERRARSLARVEDWGAAYQAFSELNGKQDALDARLESAQMMLAIQRDHLRDPEELKLSVRSVLRDAPNDQDAIAEALKLNFHPDERRRLLAPARTEMRARLQKNPLDPDSIAHFAELCRDSGEDALERVSLGLLALTGKLFPEASGRLAELHAAAHPLPSYPFSPSDLEKMTDPLLLGPLGKVVHLLAPFLAEQLDPSLEALGVTSLMRMDEFSGSERRDELGVWLGACGLNDTEIYAGGNQADAILAILSSTPTMVVGEHVPFPLSAIDRARSLAQLGGLLLGAPTLLHHSVDVLEKWFTAAERLARSQNSDQNPEIEEIASILSRIMPREVQDDLSALTSELSQRSISLVRAVPAALRSAARLVVTCHGDTAVLRSLPELLPSEGRLLDEAMADVIRFVLSDDFFSLRERSGLGRT